MKREEKEKERKEGKTIITSREKQQMMGRLHED